MAAILGKPMQVVQRLARTGRIPAYRVGHSYRFDPVRVLESCWE
jgi:excisionase family DNA binding protein